MTIDLLIRKKIKILEFKFVCIDHRGTAQKMIAKYDYDVYHNSPNIDAEQMEMSFRRGDEIVVFGGESSIRTSRCFDS